MAPVPVVLFSKAGTPPIWQHWAWFTTGWIAVSSFGIAVVYRVAGTIATGAPSAFAACVLCYLLNTILSSLSFRQHGSVTRRQLCVLRSALYALAAPATAPALLTPTQ